MSDASTILDQLNDRSREVFRRVVEAYLATGDPVSLQVADGIPLETSVAVMDALKASGARSIALRSADAQP